MIQIDRSALVFHSAQQMFDVVNDVHLYSEFLPWCASTEIISSTEQQMVASLQLAKAGLKYSFTTCNKLQKPSKIEFELVEGPFEHLSGHWDFIALNGEACKVKLILNFDFSGKIAAFAMSKVFSQVANTMVEAFVKRADNIYPTKL
ncbi:MAG: type II toxin-antitoxin system RatA family toxin [Oceanospirillaceae bacterium]|nr:type II toxin-antitoxin system RatA family toxin [Oceanospirillaceae bacterium]